MNTIGGNEEIGFSNFKERKNRVASTGGSSVKDAEIISSEIHNYSPSQSPLQKQQIAYPDPNDLQTQKMMSTLKQLTPKDSLNQTTIPIESKLIELPNVVKYTKGRKHRNKPTAVMMNRNLQGP